MTIQSSIDLRVHDPDLTLGGESVAKQDRASDFSSLRIERRIASVLETTSVTF